MSALRGLLRGALALVILVAAASATEAPLPVLQADAARIEAMLANDAAALERLLTADCLYVHSNGVVQTKREFLRALAGGSMRYTSIRYAEPPLVRRHGDSTALVTGITHLQVQLADGRTLQPTLVVTAVYVLHEGHWRLATYQSTQAPAAN